MPAPIRTTLQILPYLILKPALRRWVFTSSPLRQQEMGTGRQITQLAQDQGQRSCSWNAGRLASERTRLGTTHTAEPRHTRGRPVPPRGPQRPCTHRYSASNEYTGAAGSRTLSARLCNLLSAGFAKHRLPSKLIFLIHITSDSLQFVLREENGI